LPAKVKVVKANWVWPKGFEVVFFLRSVKWYYKFTA